MPNQNKIRDKAGVNHLANSRQESSHATRLRFFQKLSACFGS